MRVPASIEKIHSAAVRVRAASRAGLVGHAEWLRRSSPALALALAACQTYRPEMALSAYAAGDFEKAQEVIADPSFWRRNTDHDELIWLLEEAKVLRDLGRYEDSSATFERALDLFEEYTLLRPDVSVSEELLSITGSQVLRDYRGSFADAILATTLLALNDLALGNAQNARAAARQAYEWQVEAKIRFRKELERADELADEKDLDSAQLMGTPEMQAELASIDSHASPGYAEYLNPLASFVSAVAHYANGDQAEGRKALEEVLGMVPQNGHVQRLLAGEQTPADRTVYLLLERGLAPRREEFRLGFPTPHGFFTVAVPRLRFHPDAASHLRVTGSGGLDARTEPLASIDAIVATQFRHDLPGIVVRTVIAAVAKEVGQVALNEATEDEGALGVFTRISYNVFKAVASGADVRAWRTLGSECQVAVFTLPEDGAFDVHLVDEGGRAVTTRRVELAPAPLAVVCVRTIGTSVFRVAPPRASVPPN